MGKLKDLVVPPGQKLVSYDVKARFNSVPVDQAHNFIERKLRQDLTLPDRSELNLDQLIQLLEYGTVWRPPILCARDNFTSKSMEQRWVLLSLLLWLTCTWYILSPLPYLQLPDRHHLLWFRYVDDTFVLMHEHDIETLTSHTNNIADHIQFTTEP